MTFSLCLCKMTYKSSVPHRLLSHCKTDICLASYLPTLLKAELRLNSDILGISFTFPNLVTENSCEVCGVNSPLLLSPEMGHLRSLIIILLLEQCPVGKNGSKQFNSRDRADTSQQ